jgi:nitrate reductase NapE component
MTNINDDILNRFIDNELSNEEKNFVWNEIEKSTELKKSYESLLKTHLLLKNLNPDFPSVDFSKMVMQKISKRGVVEAQQKRFLFIILSLFGIVIIGIVGYMFYQIFSTIQLSDSNDIISNYSNTIKKYFSALFGKKNISILGSVLSFIMLVSGYFLYDYRKNSKKNLSH